MLKCWSTMRINLFYGNKKKMLPLWGNLCTLITAVWMSEPMIQLFHVFFYKKCRKKIAGKSTWILKCNQLLILKKFLPEITLNTLVMFLSHIYFPDATIRQKSTKHVRVFLRSRVIISSLRELAKNFNVKMWNLRLGKTIFFFKTCTRYPLRGKKLYQYTSKTKLRSYVCKG